MQLEGFGFKQNHSRKNVLSANMHKVFFLFFIFYFLFKGNIKSKKDPIQLEFATCGFKGVFKS